MAKSKKTKSSKTTETELYTATVKLLGQLNTATGNTAIEAISKLSPKNCKGRAILTVVKGDKKIERILFPNQSFVLFNSLGLKKEIALKNINTIFSNI